MMALIDIKYNPLSTILAKNCGNLPFQKTKRRDLQDDTGSAKISSYYSGKGSCSGSVKRELKKAPFTTNEWK